ncbi:hypothetical protein [Streptomyces sp. RP5T]|uniref:hypothetical protein n=1 Tax=Streptomyces sp. RP5T TaxID=2490848 RepID=UPI000F64B33C|nr:hypothetical protein [Streptomyces sp. RP5T]RRR80527.1 hypothetical protein EHS43_21100 [Streptomyces sp. RP5T]
MPQLDTDMTATTGTPTKAMSAVDFEAVGFFEHAGHWYIQGGPTCGNCEVPVTYITATDPLGSWTNEAGDTGAALTSGTVVSPNGCGGQNKAASVLPSAKDRSSWPRCGATEQAPTATFRTAG